MLLRDEFIVEQVRLKDRALAVARVITEELEVDDLKKTREAIGQLKAAAGTAWDKLPALQTGVETAREKLIAATKSISDDFGGMDSFRARLVSKAGAQVSLALTDTFTFITSILSGFKSFDEAAAAFLVTVKTANGTRKVSIADLGDEFKSLPLTDVGARAEEKLGKAAAVTTNASAVASLLLKALRPKGLMSMLKRALGSSGIPFIDEKALAGQLMGLSYTELVSMGQNAQKISPPVSRDALVDTLKGRQQNAQNAPTADQAERPPSPAKSAPGTDDFAPRAAKLVDKLDAKKRKMLLMLLKRAAQRDAEAAKASKQTGSPKPKSA